jgi:hypothetical protein
VLAFSLGAAHPEMIGADAVDGGGGRHAGLFTQRLPILAAKSGQISTVKGAAACDPSVLLIDFPALGQTTTDYEAFRTMVANTTPDQLRYVGIALRGADEALRSLTKRFSLLR